MKLLLNLWGIYLLVSYIIRFETDPGEQSQVDWTTIRSGRNPIYAFVIILFIIIK